ncbi:MAG: shikimate dehydrogenase [Deltaproteobacteria bacterium]|nr:shikimate dehydrogenase [Deltaproteobacteria bacterium]
MIDGRTQLYGVMGNPVRHSLSPIIHNGAFKRLGLNAVYLAFEVQDLKEAVRGIRGLGLCGVSVTMPFKTAVIPYLDRLDPTAEKIQSVNTITNRQGLLTGYSTDGRGAVEALEGKIPLQGKRVFLLGAGGAARAMAFSLKERGCAIALFNRSADKGLALAKELGIEFVALPSPSLGGWKAEVIINATSVGMHPHEDQSPIAQEDLQPGVTVMDIVYRPLRTRLLKEAENQGCQTIDGLEMLAQQGAAQFEIWTGLRPEIEPIKKDLRQILIAR